MHAVLLTAHTLIVLAIIVVVLLQRSDGGALGLGGSGGGFMTSRGAANVLTRTTSVLAALFFATSLTLAITAGGAEKDTDIIQELTGEKALDPNAPVTTEDLLNTLGTGANAPTGAASEPAAPILEATPEPSTGSPTPPATEPSGAPADSATPTEEPAAGVTEPQP